MNLSQQVTNLEISQKLKMFGVKQESLFWHCRWLESGDDIILSQEHLSYGQTVPIASAFTCSELGEMLPNRIKDNWGLKLSHSGKLWNVFYSAKNKKMGAKFLHNVFATTLADSMGKMLIFLYENGLIK